MFDILLTREDNVLWLLLIPNFNQPAFLWQWNWNLALYDQTYTLMLVIIQTHGQVVENGKWMSLWSGPFTELSMLLCGKKQYHERRHNSGNYLATAIKEGCWWDSLLRNQERTTERSKGVPRDHLSFLMSVALVFISRVVLSKRVKTEHSV